MSDIEPTVTERLAEASKMGQEPKDRLWAVVFVLIVLVVLVGVITVVYSETTRNFLQDGRELAYQRGAVDCLTVVVDNDRTFDIPDYCKRDEVSSFYPPEVCDEFFDKDAACGVKWDVT